jgi:hypothetical protein
MLGLVTSYWLLVTSYWLLVTGYWLLVKNSYWLQVTGCRLETKHKKPGGGATDQIDRIEAKHKIEQVDEAD